LKQAFVLAAFATTLAAVPAQAQPFAADLLPAYEVNTIVASMGMRPVGRPAWMRGRYVVAAIDRYGRDVNIVLDARDGQVLAVRPLGRGRFGPLPSGYGDGRGPGPYDERMSPPAAIPGAPPPDDGEFFDNDRQQGSLPPPRPVARSAPPARDPSTTGSITRSVPVERRATAPKDTTPVPRPRPALARANDPGNTPAAAPVVQPATIAKPDEAKPAAATPAAATAAKPDEAKSTPASTPASTAAAPATTPKPAQAEAKAEVKPDAIKREASKPAAKRTTTPQAAAKPAQANPEIAAKPDAPKPEIRVIDLSKPKTAPKPEDKPGEAIRF
jgi:hypothetical protein